MPELPEVETVVRELDYKISGKTIIDIEPVYEKVFSPGSNPEELKGLSISSVSRRAKYIIFNFEKTDLHLISHLRMTGKYLFDLNDSDARFIRCIFTFSDHSRIYFTDMRKFGRFDISSDLQEYFKEIGVEPLGKDLSFKYLKENLQKQKARPIKSFLLDQQYVAGLGNIYTDEVLFLSGVHPQRPASSLNDAEIRKVLKNIKEVLQKAVDNMGTRLTDYRNTDNMGGENRFYLYVYGQEKRPCKNCSAVIQKIKMAGRGTHFCPECQVLV